MHLGGGPKPQPSNVPVAAGNGLAINHMSVTSNPNSFMGTDNDPRSVNTNNTETAEPIVPVTVKNTVNPFQKKTAELKKGGPSDTTDIFKDLSGVAVQIGQKRQNVRHSIPLLRYSHLERTPKLQSLLLNRGSLSDVLCVLGLINCFTLFYITYINLDVKKGRP